MRCWNGPWRWNSGPTTPATGSGGCSALSKDVVQHFRALPHGDGGIGHSDGTGIYGCCPGRPEAGLRVPGADGGAVERGARGRVGPRSIRDEGVWAVPGHTHEGQARTSGSAMRPRHSTFIDEARTFVRRNQSISVFTNRLRASRSIEKHLRRIARRRSRSRPCLTGSGRASGTGRPRRLTIPARSSRRRWRMWSGTRSRRQTPTVLDVYVIIELTGFAGRIPAN